MSVYLPHPAPHMVWSGNGQFRLLAPFAVVWYGPGRERYELCAPMGMHTDLASIPRPLRSVLTGVDDTIPGAVIHDAIYRGHTGGCLTRTQADQVFLEVMAAQGVPWLKRWAMWAGVRLGGWASWRR